MFSFSKVMKSDELLESWFFRPKSFASKNPGWLTGCKNRRSSISKSFHSKQTQFAILIFGLSDVIRVGYATFWPMCQIGAAKVRR